MMVSSQMLGSVSAVIIAGRCEEITYSLAGKWTDPHFRRLLEINGGWTEWTEQKTRNPDNHRAWQVFEQWEKPFICCFSDGDPVTRGGEAKWIGRVPGTEGQPHTTLKGGHFIQEDDPKGFVDCILKVAKA